MVIALAFLSIIILAFSGYTVVFPAQLLSLATATMTGAGIWAAVAIRLLLAVLLWFTAPASHTPIIFRVLAILALIGAVLLLVIGSEGVLEIIQWIASWPLWGVRLQGVVGVAFAGFLLWSVSRSWTKPQNPSSTPD